MVEVCNNINDEIKVCLNNAIEVWVGVAMMNNGGMSLFQNLDKSILQHHIVGIDLPTPPKILKALLNLTSNSFSAKIYETDYTYHPKLYIIKNPNGNYTAFVGSSNATHSGLKNNIELNLKITDNSKCLELIRWYWDIDKKAKLITDDIIFEYAKRYKVIKQRTKRIEDEISKVKVEIEKLDQQFFTSNHHAVFHNKYSKLKNLSIKRERDMVRKQMIKLHNRIYPRFEEFNITKLKTTARSQDRTSKHYPNPYSGKSVRSVWLHYGKSPEHLMKYKTKEERAFINHARIQAIIRNNCVGTWLVLGKNWGSEIDRINFRNEMKDENIKKLFFNQLKKLDGSYWLRYDESKGVKIADIENLEDFDDVINKETLGEYFIIGKDYPNDDALLSDEQIEDTVLEQFQLLYPLYEIMIDK